MAIDKGNKKRMNIYIPEDIAEELDDYANYMGVNRSAMITMIIKQHLDQQATIKQMGKMDSYVDILKTLKGNGFNVDNNRLGIEITTEGEEA